MALIETEGVILKSYNLSDADKIVVFMCQKEGIIRGVAKGARRLKSKFGGSLEPFSVVNIIYFQNDERELVSIRSIDLEKSYFKSAGNIEFLQKFGYLAELLIEFSPPHDPNERLYKMAKVCLETGSELNGSLEMVALYFELWLLRLGGYLPIWDICKICKENIDLNKPANLQVDFQIVCNNCQKSRKNWLITPRQRNIFSIAQKVSPTKFVEMTSENRMEIIEISNILKRIISQILGKELVGDKILTAKQ